jgi:hypothetical protein
VLQVMAQFLGDEVYIGSTGTTIPTINLIPTQMLVSAVNGFNGGLVNLTANLTDTAHGVPVSGSNITFSVNGAVVGSAFTNASGIAVLQYTVTQGTGVYPILAQFLGDTTYASNSNLNILNVIVNTPPIATAFDPVNNAVNVALNKVIKVTFNQAVLMGSNWIELVNTRTGALVPVTTSISGNVLSIAHSSVLAKGVAYKVLLHTGCVTSLAGNPVGSYVTKFTTKP